MSHLVTKCRFFVLKPSKGDLNNASDISTRSGKISLFHMSWTTIELRQRFLTPSIRSLSHISSMARNYRRKFSSSLSRPVVLYEGFSRSNQKLTFKCTMRNHECLITFSITVAALALKTNHVCYRIFAPSQKNVTAGYKQRRQLYREHLRRNCRRRLSS